NGRDERLVLGQDVRIVGGGRGCKHAPVLEQFQAKPALCALRPLWMPFKAHHRRVLVSEGEVSKWGRGRSDCILAPDVVVPAPRFARGIEMAREGASGSIVPRDRARGQCVRRARGAAAPSPSALNRGRVSPFLARRHPLASGGGKRNPSVAASRRK